jgi:RNA polymerase sigma factor (TIGR02999 family)
MGNVTRILSDIDRAEPGSTEQLLPLVYGELRRLAACKLGHERPGQTLQATALVHEAFLRLVSGGHAHRWTSRRHFFAAAAEAMRRILIDRARSKQSQKRGGQRRRQPLREQDLFDGPPEWALLLDEAITRLAADDPAAAELVKLRFFTGLSVEEAAQVLEVSRSSAYRLWTYARACLLAEFGDEADSQEDDDLGDDLPANRADAISTASAEVATEPAAVDPNGNGRSQPHAPRHPR